MKQTEIKEFDVLHIQRIAAVKVAEILQINYGDLMDYSELNNLIREKDEDLFNKLNSFSSAYWNYYYYVKNINSQGSSHQMSPKEQEALNTHLKEKDEVRTGLIMEIEKRTHKPN